MPARFGLTQASYSFDSHPSECGRVMKQLAISAERYGFDSLLLADHFMQYARVGGPEQPILESWTTLGALSAVTEKLKLGTLVTCNSFRYPSHLAKIASTFDVLSHGRLILGIGAGSLDFEHTAYGVPLYSLEERLRRLDESIAIILKLWTQDQVSFEGDYYKITNAFCNPKPVQSPHPPIIIGGNSKGILELVAKHGLGCNLTGGRQNVERLLSTLKKCCVRLSRDYSDIIKTSRINILVGKNEHDVMRRLARYRPPNVAADHYIFNTLVGTPQSIAAGLQDLVDAGLDYVFIAAPDIHHVETLRTIAEEVIPLVK